MKKQYKPFINGLVVKVVY